RRHEKMSKRLTIISLACALCALGGAAARAQDSADAQDANPFAQSRPTRLPYDKEYPVMRYGRMPTHNPIAHLQQRLAAGEVKLTFTAPRGYLDSLLAALDTPQSSESLVYSKTSLQTGSINAATP